MLRSIAQRAPANTSALATPTAMTPSGWESRAKLQILSTPSGPAASPCRTAPSLRSEESGPSGMRLPTMASGLCSPAPRQEMVTFALSTMRIACEP